MHKKIAGALTSLITYPLSFCMPILWRHLLGQYVKVLGISVAAFMGILLSTRLDDIARFASAGAEGNMVFKFALYQIPYILPIVIPIAALISSIILFQQMSQSHEFTALRASGFGIRQIIAPILCAGMIMALVNLYVVSELATRSHLATRQLQNELQTLNPLVLLQNTSFLRMRGFYVNILGTSKAGEQISDVVFAANNTSEGRLNLIVAKKLQYNPRELLGQNVTIITGGMGSSSDGFDSILLDHSGNMTTPITEFSPIFRKEGWKLSNDHLKMSLLLVRAKEAAQALASAKIDKKPLEILKEIKAILNSSLAEISRRLSLGAAVFAFTLMGVSFGISVGRRTSVRGILYVIGLAALYLSCFFLGKGNATHFAVATILYFAPILLIVFLSTWNLRRITQGVE